MCNEKQKDNGMDQNTLPCCYGVLCDYKSVNLNE